MASVAPATVLSIGNRPLAPITMPRTVSGSSRSNSVAQADAAIGTSVSRTSTGNAVLPAKVLMPTIEGSVNQTPAPVDTAREAA